jgi:AraC-like DNA-binding protein
MNNEIEIIRYPQIPYLNAFVIGIEYRTPHLHRDFEIDLVLEGSLNLHCRGETATARTGELFLLNPNEPHELRSADGASVLCLQIAPNFFAQFLPADRHVRFGTHTPYAQFETGSRTACNRFLLEFAEYYFRKPPSYQLRCIGNLCSAWEIFLNGLPVKTLTDEELFTDEKKTQRLLRLLDFTDKNYTRKIRLQDFAEQEGLSLFHLSRFVKENLNMTFQEYVTMLRFHLACKLLLSSKKSLLEIAMECGFSDTRYLYAAFDRALRVTPTEFRKTKSEPPRDVVKTHRSEHSMQRYFSLEKNLALIEGLNRYNRT